MEGLSALFPVGLGPALLLQASSGPEPFPMGTPTCTEQEACTELGLHTQLFTCLMNQWINAGGF